MGHRSEEPGFRLPFVLDQRGFAVFLMLISIAASYLAGGVLFGVICLTLAVMLALVLWTPLRGWLGIPPSKSESAVLPLMDRLRPVLSEGMALVPRLDPTCPTLDVLKHARKWQRKVYTDIAGERMDLAQRFLDATDPIEERETQSLTTVNPARLIMEEHTTALKKIIDHLEAGQ